MADLRELYQELIVEHSKRPRNFRKLEPSTSHAEGFNPLCGDKVAVYLQIREGRIADIGFQGSGCAISTSSASIMTETLKGKTTDEASKLFEKFHGLVTGKVTDPEGLGKLAVFSGVSEFPARVKCASLAWHTLHNALSGSHEIVNTEKGDSDSGGTP